MALLINLRDIEDEDAELAGELSIEELEFDFTDEVIHFAKPLTYQLTAQSLPDAVLVRGKLRLVLDCECVRCMKPVEYPLEFPDWACHLPTTGEEKVPINMGSVDLTPYIREDMVLAFPQHPLCREDCPGLAPKQPKPAVDMSADGEKKSPWDQLNQLKL